MLAPLLMSLALAQPAQESLAPLGGPAVAIRSEAPTLVRFDFGGRLRRPEISPQEAALGLLGLERDVLERAEGVLAARAAAVDRFVVSNLLLLGELDTAGQAGNKLDQAVTIARLVDAIRPLLEAGTLDEQIAVVLPPGDAARFCGLMKEYWDAVTREALAENRAAGKRDPRLLVLFGERVRHVGEEIARSYERQSAGGTLFVDYLLADLELSAAQREVMMGLKLDFVERAGMRPTEKQQQVFVVGALAYLTAEQRARVIKKIPR
jgi:hypothetical protein